MSPARLADELYRHALLIMPVVVLLGLGVRREPQPGLREDEVECEEARAHLIDCCPTFGSNLACSYVDNGVCDAPTYPDLSSDDAVSVQRLSCGAIQTSDWCARQFDHSPSDEGY